MTAHKREVEAIRKLVAAVGGMCNVTHQVGRLRGSAGIPDLYIQISRRLLTPDRDGMPREREGFTFWCEVKVGKDSPSLDQEYFIQEERHSNGAPVIVGGLADVIEYLRGQGLRIE